MLAIGNCVVGITAMSQFFVSSFPQLVAARVAIDAGSSPQHPLGSSILSRYYPQSRGWALTFHHSAGNLGSFIGPAAASLALLYFTWQTAFVIFGAFSLVMGLTLFLVKDHAGGASEQLGGKAKAKAGFDCLSPVFEEPQHRPDLVSPDGRRGGTRHRCQHDLSGAVLHATNLASPPRAAV